MKLPRLAFPALFVTLLDCRPFTPASDNQQHSRVVAKSHAAPGSWLAIDQISDAPSPERLRLGDAIVGTFFDDEVSKPGGYTYAYGDKTRNKVLPSSSAGNAAVFATYFGDDYSGVNISLGTGKHLDLTPYRKTGSLTFWIKGGPLAQKFMLGLMDDQGGGKRVQSKVIGDSYVVVQSAEWTQCRIPLKAFVDDGTYWDAAQQREVGAKVDWAKISDFRISINRGENKVAEGAPVAFYLDQIQVTGTSKGVLDPEVFWNTFHSDAPEQLVTDFSKPSEKWLVRHGNSAEISASVVKLPAGAPTETKGQMLKVDFKPGDWFDAFIRPESVPGMPNDWSKHYGLSVWLYTDKPYQSFDFVIYDRSSEMFTARVGASRGWHQILVPFRSFAKFPYFQPPEAKQNNQLDLDGVVQFGLKPGGEVTGVLYLASVRATNRRELKNTRAAPLLLARLGGDMRKALQKIPDIYGINTALYAPDFLDPRSATVERALALNVVRYPGGLRADEEDWQKTLRAKNASVDTDEFLNWCEGLGCTPMFTANVGDGTPESAAAWVKYVNQTRKGPKVKLWEIGNEIYGDWHHYYATWGRDGGTKYGKAVRAYVKAMKAVDPSLKISAVWMLGGAWNRAVFKEVADVVDAVSVHHYPQNAGSESDLGLLASASEVDALMRDVRKQVLDLGVHGRAYEIWLTEWNSVDANPNAQIMQHVNALFVADYLGHLAQSPIQIANLWALYNGRDKRLGDYSVLAPSSDPQGFNFRRPSYWGFQMMANTLTGTLLSAATNQEALSGWMCRHADGRLALVFVNKSFESDFQTAIKIPGLSGSATISVLSADTSGGLLDADAFGKVHPSTGPKVERRELADGSSILVPKASIVTVAY